MQRVVNLIALLREIEPDGVGMLVSKYMNQQMVFPAKTLDKLGQLADLLEQASRLLREIGQRNRYAVPMQSRVQPADVPADEEWFWTKDWQAGEREADEALAQGDCIMFDTAKDAIDALHRHV